MKDPKVSVLTTVYNGAAFLAQAVESILGQSFSDFEFIIVDDGSTDSTPEILRYYKDPRVLIVNHGRLGRSVALNLGLSLARAEHVAIMDADDVSLPNRLALQHRAMAALPELDLVASPIDVMDSTGRTIDRFWMQFNASYRLWRLQFQNNYAHGSIMMRKDAAIKAGMYSADLKVCHDYKLLTQICRVDNTEIIPSVMYRYRVSYAEDQITGRHADAMTREAAAVSNQALRSCHPTLTGEVAAGMRPLYWRLERQFVSEEGLDAIPVTLDGFCRKFGLNGENRKWLARRVASDTLRSIARHSDATVHDRTTRALLLTKEWPLTIPRLLLSEIDLYLRKVFRRTWLFEPLLRFVRAMDLDV